ncbi:unannotated protein [freshwater metagenome]|uniref:Unannotated protein n=1 Tax=freshwater metagenome TaxID=449393 RepID=A0A6J7EGT8_9ZZZZ|nr:hypothetical protein [Actinomycetota bacterium]
MRAAVAVLLAGAVAIGATACGSEVSGTPGGKVPGDSVTVYSSLPLRGPQAAVAASMVNGQKLALADADGRVGDLTVKFVSLDSSTGPGGIASGAAALNARRAVRDPSTIGYIGEAGFEASATSTPLLNAGGIAQVSPLESYAGFTTRTPGTSAGDPERWYPSGVRTFARVVPSASAEAAAQAAWQAAEGCRRTLIVADLRATSRALAAAAQEALTAAAVRTYGPSSAEGLGVALGIQRTPPDCVFVAGVADPIALWRALSSALPRALLFAPSGAAREAFIKALTPAEQALTRITRPVVGPAAQEPAARALEARYRKVFGSDPAPEMLFGYEAMQVILEGIRLAGPNSRSRSAVAAAIHRVKRSESPLGSYAIRRDGDTTLRRMGGWTVRGGELRFARVLYGGP